MAENPTASPAPDPNPSIPPSPSLDATPQSLLPSTFQHQTLQRSASPMQRITQIQHQFGPAAVASAMRHHAGIYGGQMNFAGQQQQVPQAGVMSRVGMMGQTSTGGQVQMLPGQGGAGVQFNLQPQLLSQVRQKAGLVQSSQFHPANSSAQALQGMQTMGMTSSLGFNSQIRANGALPYAQQRVNQGQLRQQQLSQSQISSAQKLPSQGMTRTTSLASMNQLTGTTQNGQTTMIQGPQQQWMKQSQLAMSGSGSPSYHLQQRQQQVFLQQQLQKNMSPQQISQLVQQSPLHGSQQQSQPQAHQILQQQQQQLQQQQQHHQQSPRMPGSVSQKSMNLSGLSDAPASAGSSQGTEANNQLLGKRKIQDLVSQVDSRGTLDPEVEDFFLEFADDFIEVVMTAACNFAKHRKSSTVEAKDLLLHLENNWHLKIPGYTKEQTLQREMLPVDIHMKRLKLIHSMMESSQADVDAAIAKGVGRQITHDPSISNSIKASPSMERLISPPAVPPLPQNVQRF